ncbi:MAG: protein kinase, partial [Deltaproteobacteria bacterium]|nr:protein kinase [Deltaproteobacteria bacterium]
PQYAKQLHGRLRMQREAQAIARLSHPNVVAVHDVGTVGHQVFIAMEFVEGTTLTQWLRARPRTTDQIVDCLLQAGAGLQAAHAAGLVHRDFKPDNVLVGTDDRARVVDFGLVRADADRSESSASNAAVDDSQEALAPVGGAISQVDLTAAGAMVGTPAYMSPEQFAGTSSDARSDQFSFCVALYEALYGERPFEGTSAAELAMTVSMGDIRTSSATARRVSGRLRRVLVRGLSVEPHDRYPDMLATLTAIRGAVAPRRARWAAVGVAALAVVGGTVAWTASGTACAPTTEAAALWSPAHKQQIRTRLMSVDRPFAPYTWGRVATLVDERQLRWASIQHDLCEAIDDPSERQADPRQHCLDARLHETAVLLELFEQADLHVVTEAVQMTRTLTSVEDCASLAVASRIPVPTELGQREQATALQHDILDWRVRTKLGHTDATDQQLRGVIARSEALAFDPLLAEMAWHRGHREEHRGKIERAVEFANEAFEIALRGRHDEMAYQAATYLTFLHGARMREPERGLEWGRRAEALWIRNGSRPHSHMPLLSNLATTRIQQGKPVEALERYEQALIIARQAGNPLALSRLLNNLGAFYVHTRDPEQARRYLAEAAALSAEILGPDHPDTLRSHFNAALILVTNDQYEAGARALAPVLERQAAALGTGHPEYANTLEAMSLATTAPGQLEAVEAMCLEVAEIRSDTLGPENPATIKARISHANAVLARGDSARATVLAAELGQFLEGRGAPFTLARVRLVPLTVYAAIAQGNPHTALETAAEGQRLCDDPARCIESMRPALLTAMGHAQLANDQPEAATASFHAALALEAIDNDLATMLRCHFGLAVTLQDDPSQHEIAVEHATKAQRAGARGNASTRALLPDVDAWLADHR